MYYLSLSLSLPLAGGFFFSLFYIFIISISSPIAECCYDFFWEFFLVIASTIAGLLFTLSFVYLVFIMYCKLFLLFLYLLIHTKTIKMFIMNHKHQYTSSPAYIQICTHKYVWLKVSSLQLELIVGLCSTQLLISETCTHFDALIFCCCCCQINGTIDRIQCWGKCHSERRDKQENMEAF